MAGRLRIATCAVLLAVACSVEPAGPAAQARGAEGIEGAAPAPAVEGTSLAPASEGSSPAPAPASASPAPAPEATSPAPAPQSTSPAPAPVASTTPAAKREGASTPAPTTERPARHAEDSLDQRLREARARREEAEAAASAAVAKADHEVAEVKNLTGQLAASKLDLLTLTADLAERQRRVRNLEVSLGSPKEDLPRKWADSLPHQEAITVAMGVLGALSIVGPSSYTRPFLALVGSAVGGLLVASISNVAYADFVGPEKDDTLFVDAALELLGGKSDKRWYCVWAAAVLLGAIRYCLQIDRRPHDVYWPSRCCSPCKGSPPLPPPPPREDSMLTANSMRTQAQGGIGGGLGTPSTQAPRDNTPAFSMASASPRLPPLPPAPPVARR